MRVRWMAVASLSLGLAIVSATPATVLACSSEHPSFRETVAGAEAIATVTVLERFDSRGKGIERYRVVRVLKGALPARVRLDHPYSGLCHDVVGSIARSKRAEIVVAFGMSYYGDVIHPAWAMDRGVGVHGSAGVPDRIDSLAELEAAILAELGMPATSTLTVAPEPTPVPSVLPLLAGLVAGWLVIREAGRRRRAPRR